MSEYLKKIAPATRERFRFRWRYLVAGFLVFGVLSLTIAQEDPLLRDAKLLNNRYTATFKINKDAKTATRAELDGPDEKTYPIASPVLQALVRDVYHFGKRISSESFARGSRFDLTSSQIQAVAEAAVIYQNIQLGIYKNYLRLAHDAKSPLYKNPGAAGTITRQVLGSLLGGGTGVSGQVLSSKWEMDRWEKLNRDALNMPGARAFSPNAYEFLNLRLHPTIGWIFYGTKEYGKQFNVRNVKDDKTGHYTQVELFLNSFEKQIAEYEAIQDPKDKGEYMKLLQFAALREGMANRWALRRILPGVNAKTPLALSDKELNSCGVDLVSFRVPKGGTVNDVEAYHSLWQQDRYEDLTQFGTEAAAAATTNRPLFTQEEYAEAYLQFVAGFSEFPVRVLSKFGANDDPAKTLNAIRQHFATASQGSGSQSRAAKIAANEEYIWSDDRSGGKSKVPEILAREKFLQANFPGDDLTIPAVAERYADQAYTTRLQALADAMVALAQVDSDDLPKVNLPSGKQLEVVEEENPYFREGEISTDDFSPASEVSSEPKVLLYSEARNPQERVRALEIVRKLHAPKEKIWKQTVAREVEKALLAKLGMSLVSRNGNPLGTGYLTSRAKERYEDFQTLVMKAGAIGARGVQVREAAEKAASNLASKALTCTQAVYQGATAGAGGITCTVNHVDPKTLKNPTSPENYAGFAPFRVPAAQMGIKEIILPETATQLSQFFRKKLQAVLEFKNGHLKYAEPEIAKEIAENPTVLRGIEMLFGRIDEIASQAGGDGNPGDSGNTLAQVGNVKSTRGRKTGGGSHELTVQESAQPDNAEAVARRRALEGALLPGAKKAYEEFVKGLETPGTYKFPKLAIKALEEQNREIQERIKTGKKQFEKRKQREAQIEETKEEQRRRVEAYFRPGRDRSLERTGGEFYLQKKEDREKAKRLYIEALGMLGLAQPIAAAPAYFRTKNKFLPDQIVSWVTNEQVLGRRLSGASLLERMVSTVTDQYALAQVFEQESIARAPILTLQSTWKWRKSEKKEPVLLHKIAKYWSPKGWDETGFKMEFRKTLESALANDVDKVETFCRADVKNYRNDVNFRMLFQTVSGVRSAFTHDERIQKWDDEITSEVKTLNERIVGVFDGHTVGLLVAMFVIQIGMQIALAFMTGGSSLLLSGITARFGFSFLARLFAFQFTGNLGLVNLFFSFQTYAMISVYHYRMPPQVAFTFQVANSQIQNMEMNRFDGKTAAKLENLSLVDRERLQAMRKELFAMQTATYAAMGMEVAQLGVFTIPQARRSLGIAGQKRIRRLGSASTKEFVDSTVRTESLRDLYRKTGSLEAAMDAYWPKARIAIRSLARINVVKGGAQAQKGLEYMLGNKLAKEFIKDRKTLLKFLEASKERIDSEIRVIVSKRGAKAVKDGVLSESDLAVALGREGDEAIAPLVKEATETGQDEAGLLLVDRRFEERVEALSKAADAIGSQSQQKSRVAHWMDFKAKKLSRLRQESEHFAKLIQTAEKSPVGEFDNLDFMLRRTPSDFGLIVEHARKAEDVLDKATRKGIRRAYKDFKYLQEDWMRADPIARSYARMAARGVPDLIVDKDGVVWKAEEFVRNPNGTYTATRLKKNAGGEPVFDIEGRPVIQKAEMRFDIDPEDFYNHPGDYESISAIIRKRDATTGKAPYVDSAARRDMVRILKESPQR